MNPPPFRFPLQKVLELRREKEAASATRLGEARREATAAREARDTVEALRVAGRERIMAAHAAGGAVGVLRHLELVAENLDEGVRHHAEAHREAEAEVARRLENLREALRDRQVLDRLRDRAKGEHDTEWLRRQQAVLDDMTAARFAGADDANGRTT